MTNAQAATPETTGVRSRIEMPDKIARAAVPGVLLKARPIDGQLADRLANPVPDGMELYVHEMDVAGPVGDYRWRQVLHARFAAVAHLVPEGFRWIVEGPVWALDGTLFGLGGNRPVDRLLVERLVALATDLGAWAVNIHAVDGTDDPTVVHSASRDRAIDRAVPFLAWYVQTCRDAGLVPLVENVPPICRMRREAFVFTPYGVEPEDMRTLVSAVPGLRLTLDLSHAQLAVNALRGVPPNPGSPSTVFTAAAAYRERGAITGITTLDAFVEELIGDVDNVHVANASGLLDEGAPYDQGDADLDRAVRRLARVVTSFVTEPLDSDEAHAAEKRRMQMSLHTCLGTRPGDAREATLVAR
jgi:hypothetical protein